MIFKTEDNNVCVTMLNLRVFLTEYFSMSYTVIEAEKEDLWSRILIKVQFVGINTLRQRCVIYMI